MVAPDRVEKGSTDASGRESIRFIKNLSNGVVVVVEKEYKNSPDDTETINIWADLSSEAINAQQKAAPGIHVQNAILDIDVAKIRKDAEEAIRADVEYLQKRANATSGEQKFRITPDILAANERFNEELDDFKAKTHKGLLHLGKPGAILRTIGVDADEMTLSPSVLSRHLKKHNLTADDLIGLPLSVQPPILAYKHGDKNPNLVVVTEMDVKGGKLSVSLELDENGHVVEIDNTRSVHSKDATKEMARLGAMREGELEKALRWVEKEEVQDWLGIADLNRPIHTINPELSSVANVLLSFKNPPIIGDESSQNDTNATSGVQKFRRYIYHEYRNKITVICYGVMEIFIQSKKVVRDRYVLNRLFVWLVPYRDATHKQNTEAYKEKTRKCCLLLSN